MLNRQARNAVAELQRAGVDDLTADEIVRLHVLGEAFDRALKDADHAVSSPPARVGGVTLWPLTCAAEDWLDRAEEWFEDRPVARFWALPFAMAHGREPGFFEEEAGDADDALVAIYRFHKGIAATEDEVAETISTVMGMRAAVEREEARTALLAWTEWAQRADPAGKWPETREKGLAALKADEEARNGQNAPEGASAGQERGFQAWKVYCVELGVLTGTDPAVWYGQDLRLVLHAMAKAREARRLRDGDAPGRETYTRKQKEALLALRKAVAEIKKSRTKKED